MEKAQVYIFTDTKVRLDSVVLGRNLFRFSIINNGQLIPHGSSQQCTGLAHCRPWKTQNSCNPDAPESPGNHIDSGDGCAGRIIEEGWQMKY